ncbi:glycosyltransferase family 39 protein [Sulfurirhabdus autotrophica]|uniref:Dolichyl-phosphate-mannose-protein mannosyltransferase n=1 Tax=Sulfurirhabdus autotrophica TaxID=1706046 RepID=A0A4R3YHN8_9PROT|nr:glycosyltransferase family 39 protein [Sulfurirhabdus autotrophica]TCV90103.1 dolichyl-phosphate-mannose-protein mannosyltransferase [Sulfurirhabdus autotrophica]
MNFSNVFKATLLATFLIKLLLAYVIPMSGDEAYFIIWAKNLDFGYYDHPPMAGWFLYGMRFLGDSEVILRLPAILLSSLIGIGIYQFLKTRDETKAALIAILFLISPLNIINVLITTDTPLILFAFLSAASLYKALEKDQLVWYGLSGIFFGMAFLSKYFAVLLGLAYLTYFLFSTKNWHKSRGFALLYLAALPFALINIYWNYTHCWDNILFNLYTRNEGEQFSLGKIATYFGTQIYLMTPPVVYYLFKHRANFVRSLNNDNLKLFFFAFFIPMAAFAALALKKLIGLHWVLAFYPFLYILLFHYLSRAELIKTTKFMAWFSITHLAIITVISVMPMETWIKTKWYDGIVFMFKTNEIADHIRPYEKQFLLAADGYTPAAIISYSYGKDFFVFGEGSYHARQDDIVTDFRQFSGRNILIVKKSAPDISQYAPYFQRVEFKQFTLRGATFFYVLGYNFNYEQYKIKVLTPIKDKYYKIPDYLPHTPCYFCEKYFNEGAKP